MEIRVRPIQNVHLLTSVLPHAPVAIPPAAVITTIARATAVIFVIKRVQSHVHKQGVPVDILVRIIHRLRLVNSTMAPISVMGLSIIVP